VIKRWQNACLPLYDDTEHYSDMAAEVFSTQCQSEAEKFSRWREITEGLQQIHKAIKEHKVTTLSNQISAIDAVQTIQTSVDKMLLLLTVNQSTNTLDTNQLMSVLRRMSKFKRNVVHEVHHNRWQTDEHDDDDKKQVEFLKLIHRMLDYAKDHHCIRIGNTRIQQAIFVKGRFTNCYKDFGETGDVSEFIEECVSTDDEFWNLLNSRPNFAEQLAKRLQKTKDPSRLPQKTRKKERHGFLDGMWDAIKLKFYPWDSVAFRLLPKDTWACAAFHNCYFNDEETEWYIRGKGETDFLNIPEPTQDICKLQEWGKDEIIHILAEAAAMFHYKIRPETVTSKMEKNKSLRHPFQQHMPIHLGPGGCGKTTLLKIFSLFFDPQDICHFKTQDEDVFGMERLPESLAIFGYDIGRNWKIDPHFLFTIIDGGWIKLNRKFKTSMLYFVDQFIMIAMNDYLAMNDPGQALSRRIPLHKWDFLPTKSNSNLVLEAVPWVGFLMKKCCLSLDYLTRVVYKGAMATKEHPGFPQSMKNNIREMQQHITPTFAFFESDNIVFDDEKRTKGYYVEKTIVRQRYNNWCKRTGIVSKVQLSGTALNDALKHFKLRKEYQVRPDYYVEVKRKFAAMKTNSNQQSNTNQNNNNNKNSTGSNRNNIANKMAASNNNNQPVALPVVSQFPTRDTEWIVGCTLSGMEEECKHGVRQYEILMAEKVFEEDEKQKQLNDAEQNKKKATLIPDDEENEKEQNDETKNPPLDDGDIALMPVTIAIS
jgi:hypothetical protein